MAIRLPMGVTPKWIWESEMKKQRANTLLDAMARYRTIDAEIPMEWVIEYLDLIMEEKHNE